ASARSSGVRARSTRERTAPAAALISVRAASTADAGRASPQTLRPDSSQQYRRRSLPRWAQLSAGASASPMQAIVMMVLSIAPVPPVGRVSASAGPVTLAVGPQTGLLS